jgi:CubicO group peptidase (beta-lactamase class C family)
MAILVLMLVGSIGSTAVQAQDEGDPITRIEAALASLVERDIFSGTILIARDGEILFHEAYGYAVREWEIPNTTESVYLIASLTKQFTAMGILLLQERGLLTVQDRICQYVEDCPAAWADITIRHLLTHTSGIPDYVNFSDYRQLSVMQTNPRRLIDRFIGEPLDFTPGED